MAHRFRTLTPAEAASLLNELSDSSAEESDGSLDEGEERDDSIDEDALHVREESDESDDEPPPPPVSRQQLTKSQRTLQEADLQPQPPRDAGPYVVREGRRRDIAAEWQTEPPAARRRRNPANILTQAAGVQGRAKIISHKTEAFKLFITDDISTRSCAKQTSGCNVSVRTRKPLAAEAQLRRLCTSSGTSHTQKCVPSSACAFCVASIAD